MKKKQHILCSVLLLGFLLGIKDRYIALWEDGSDRPVKVFSYPAAMLPESAQRQLEQGIRVETQEELMLLLENYLS